MLRIAKSKTVVF